MSREKLSSILVREGFSVVSDNAWKMGDILIMLSKGFLYVTHNGVCSLNFPFREDDVFDFMVLEGNLVIWYGNIAFTQRI